MDSLKQFIAEFWLWILIPALLVGIGVAALLLMGGSDESSPFTYNIF